MRVAGIDDRGQVVHMLDVADPRAPREGLATITSDPPEPERGIDIKSVYVRPDGARLELARAVVGGGGGAVVLEM